MPPQPFTLSYPEPRGTVLLYDGPFGPLRQEALTDDRGAEVTGPGVGSARLLWPEHPPSKHGRSLDAQLDRGVPIEVDGVPFTLQRRPVFSCTTRARRAIRVDRPDRPGRLRVRGRGLITLELESGTPLVQLRSWRRPGTVHPDAGPADVAIFLLAWARA